METFKFTDAGFDKGDGQTLLGFLAFGSEQVNVAVLFCSAFGGGESDKSLLAQLFENVVDLTQAYAGVGGQGPLIAKSMQIDGIEDDEISGIDQGVCVCSRHGIKAWGILRQAQDKWGIGHPSTSSGQVGHRA